MILWLFTWHHHQVKFSLVPWSAFLRYCQMNDRSDFQHGQIFLLRLKWGLWEGTFHNQLWTSGSVVLGVPNCVHVSTPHQWCADRWSSVNLTKIPKRRMRWGRDELCCMIDGGLWHMPIAASLWICVTHIVFQIGPTRGRRALLMVWLETFTQWSAGRHFVELSFLDSCFFVHSTVKHASL